ncbi:TonB-dependent receptor [Xanthomonas arboricola]|uniref:TonB-dependent receptor n=1 Tax=Xanthomonas arboricola TaxID=56448 RepID=UPI002B2C37E9|nr:TonB-dependent receptor [Xanthomonas arboricola]
MNKLHSNTRHTPLAAALAAALTLLAGSAGAQDAGNAAGVTDLDKVMVKGVRGAQAEAIENKRTAAQIIDSISAEDIGKLPDVTITDSLQRVPGVQIRRSAGEGSQLNIRGMPQVQTTMNGELYLSAGGGDQYGQPNIGRAQPDFVDIPPTLFSGVDVIKSPTAADLDGGISGTVSLKTRRPFDLPEGWTFSGQAEGSYGDRVQELNELYSGLASFRTERWGALLAVSYSDATLENKHPSVYSNGAQKSNEQNVGFDFNGDGRIGSNTDPSNLPRDYFYNWVATELDNRSTDRQRTGINGSFQFNINDSWTVLADAAYTKLEDQDTSVAAQLHTGWATNQLQPGSVVDSNGVLEYGQFRYNRFQAHSMAGVADSDALNTNLELRFDDGGPLRASFRWVHGDAQRTYDEARVDAVVTRGDQITRAGGVTQWANANGLPTVDASVDFRGTYPAVNLGTDVSNPDNWQLMSTWAQGNKIEATMDAFRADGTFEFDEGVVRGFQFGIRYGEREVKLDTYRYLSPVSTSCADPNRSLYYFKDPLIVDTCSGVSEARLLPFNSIPGYWAYFNDFDPLKVTGLGSQGLPAINPQVMKDPVGYLNSLYPGNVAYQQAADSYKVTEKSTAAYFLANLEGGTGSAVPWTANIGARIVQTKLAIDQYLSSGNVFIGNVEWNGVSPAIGTNRLNRQYTDVLPTANLSLDITDAQKLRFAYNKAVARQDLPDLGRGLVSFYAVNGTPPRNPALPSDAVLFLNGRSGNPDLDPYRATNYNASWEWYFSDASLVSVGAFLIDVKSFPTTVTNIELLPDADGVARLGGPVERIVNGGGGKIKGFEVGYQQAFDFLPGWLSGFGTNINYTFSDADTDNTDIDGNTLPIGDNSKHQANAVLWYQKDKLQARVAYNWRSKRFSQVNSGAWGDELAIWNDDVGYLDASFSYDVNDHLTLYAQATNLTGESERRYAQWTNHYYDQNIFERRYYAGLRLRF